MNTSITIQPVSYVNGIIKLPGSKSISNRILLLSAISQGITKINNLLYSDDTYHMLNVLKIIGVKVELSEDKKSCIVYGNKNAFQHHNKSLFIGNAGTAMRSLVAIFSLGKNNITLTGDARMQERPIKHLVNALMQGGAIINYVGNKNCPPVHLKGGFIGGNISVNGNISSQFLTGLLLVSPMAAYNTIISVKNILVSKPYIDMTLKLISLFGIKIINNKYTSFVIEGNQKYKSPKFFAIEGDISSGSYFLAAAAIKGKKVKVIGIGKDSIQGDIKFVDVLKKMGSNIFIEKNFICCRKGHLKNIDLDMNHIPDAAMTIAIVALFAQGTTVIRNIYNWRVKETDRILAMSTELRKIGAKIIEGTDYISITPPKKFCHAVINTYNDHRIAMCFSLISLSNVPVTILNPECVTKTYPNFFSDLLSICSFK